ncbi:MAG: hypothetical protein JXR76_20670 [Deltaproteobacteria bacterium]|nr:hypothetical protein [Deltaproteobacteria bacterium]
MLTNHTRTGGKADNNESRGKVRVAQKAQGNRLLSIAGLFMLLITAACNEEFEKFTDVTKLRVLAIQVEPAELIPGETGTINALVDAPDGEDVQYKWSWCPIATTSLNGHECPVTEEMLLSLISQNTGVPTVLLPDVPLFNLGNGPNASFPYVIGEDVLQLACDQVVNQLGDTLPILPDCEGKLVSTIRLDVTAKEQTMTAVKQMNLILNSDIVPNQNPGVEQMYQRIENGLVELVNDSPMTFAPKDRIDLRVTVPKAASETYETLAIETGEPVMKYENLFITWFITGGDTEFGRTSYIPAKTPFEQLMLNTWWLPRADEVNGKATIHVVLQDGRGGVSWTSRTIRIEER